MVLSIQKEMLIGCMYEGRLEVGPTYKLEGVSRGLRPGSKVCSEHMNDWQFLSLGDLELKEIFPESIS